jgi:hypothetical protein
MMLKIQSTEKNMILKILHTEASYVHKVAKQI